jgi:hypothetical protein
LSVSSLKKELQRKSGVHGTGASPLGAPRQLDGDEAGVEHLGWLERVDGRWANYDWLSFHLDLLACEREHGCYALERYTDA